MLGALPSSTASPSRDRNTLFAVIFFPTPDLMTESTKAAVADLVGDGRALRALSG
jgi:hypothetical protein